MKIESVETCINPENPDWEPLSEEDGKKKRDTRVIFSPEQICILEAHYEANAFPKADLREQIGEELGLTAKKVDVWFKNRRAKAKREDKEVVPLIVKQVKIYNLMILVIILRENLSLIFWIAGTKFGRESTESPKWK